MRGIRQDGRGKLLSKEPCDYCGHRFDMDHVCSPFALRDKIDALLKQRWRLETDNEKLREFVERDDCTCFEMEGGVKCPRCEALVETNG